MEYVNLGHTGLRVSRLALGCMSFGSSNWEPWVKDEEESIELIRKAYEAGINFFDTADVYSNGESERVLGKAIQRLGMTRSRIVIATKLYYPLTTPSFSLAKDDPEWINQKGISRKHIFDAVDASLTRLGLDYIDLYQLHRLDQDTPLEEVMEALNDLVRMGKVRYIGCSSCFAWQFQKMNWIAKKHGWTQFVSMQNCYNLIYREEEREMIPYCQDAGIALIPWSPLAMGILAGRHRHTTRSQSEPGMDLFFNKPQDATIVERVADLAQKKACTASQIALAWILHKPAITCPIIGISQASYLDDLIGALSIQLNQEDMDYLEALYTPRALIPM
ncbi:NADP-dependent oxidoreductase domain-containing protein [Blakeslea trispora]|nr:NADP-dependent oxidoreductase domain-containing protein [Blakeslea trispora]